MSDISIIDLSKPIKTSEIKGKIVQMSRSDFIDLLLGSGLSDNYLQEAIEELEQENKELKAVILERGKNWINEKEEIIDDLKYKKERELGKNYLKGAKDLIAYLNGV